MKLRLIMGIVLCGVLLALSPLAISGNDCGVGCGPSASPGKCGGQPAAALKEAGATDEQMKQLGELKSVQQLTAVDLRASVENAMLKIKRVLAEDAPEEAALDAAIEEVGRGKIAV